MANRLNPAAPADTAFVGDGAGEIRGVKTWITDVFPNLDGEITKPSDYGPVTGSTQPTESDYSQLFTDVAALNVTVGGIDTGIVPVGTIAMWSGTDTSGLNAKGWFLCDGTNSTPNLQNKFIKGWGTESIGASGGGGGTIRTSGTYQVGNGTDKTITNTVTLEEANIPQHSHYAVSLTVNSPRSDANEIGAGGAYLARKATGGSSNLEYSLEGTSALPSTGRTTNWGNASATPVDLGIDATEFAHEHEIDGDIEPPYYVLAYIIYKGV